VTGNNTHNTDAQGNRLELRTFPDSIVDFATKAHSLGHTRHNSVTTQRQFVQTHRFRHVCLRHTRRNVLFICKTEQSASIHHTRGAGNREDSTNPNRTRARACQRPWDAPKPSLILLYFLLFVRRPQNRPRTQHRAPSNTRALHSAQFNTQPSRNRHQLTSEKKLDHTPRILAPPPRS
jgi:hypothetical protein